MGESDLDAAGMPNPLARQQLVLAWFVYGIVLIGLIAFIISPACVTTVIDDSHRHRTADLVKVVNSREELREKVPVLFNLLRYLQMHCNHPVVMTQSLFVCLLCFRKNWNVIDINSDQSESQIFVFGLATGYSSSIVALLSLVIVTLVFLLGDGLAPGLFSLILSGALLLEVQNIAGNSLK